MSQVPARSISSIVQLSVPGGYPPPACAVPAPSFGVPSAFKTPGVEPTLPPGRSRVEAPPSPPGRGVGHVPGFGVAAGPRPGAVLACCVPLGVLGVRLGDDGVAATDGVGVDALLAVPAGVAAAL